MYIHAVYVYIYVYMHILYMYFDPYTKPKSTTVEKDNASWRNLSFVAISAYPVPSEFTSVRQRHLCDICDSLSNRFFYMALGAHSLYARQARRSVLWKQYSTNHFSSWWINTSDSHALGRITVMFVSYTGSWSSCQAWTAAVPVGTCWITCWLPSFPCLTSPLCWCLSDHPLNQLFALETLCQNLL